jgi:two-component system cell cycle sensor histidine kinase/response regulator CckA
MDCEKTPKLLVVEDDDDDFFLVQDLLRSEIATQGEQARSVDEALARIGENEYDLMLVDYSLGARNGLDLLAELRARESVTPVIFLTGHGGEEVAVRALKGGAVDYLAKAKMTAEGLGSAVRHALALRARDAAVREAREALAEREREYRTLFEKANDAITIIDPETEVILAANRVACRMYQCEHDQLRGRSLIEFTSDVTRGREAIAECLRSGELTNFETVQVSREGRPLSLLVNASLIDYRGRPAVLSVSRDITERKAAEREIFRLNRALKALSKCNEALMRARDAQNFLDDICNIVVQVGGYRMAWVAAAPAPPEDAIRPLAWAGATGDYLAIVCQRYGEREEGPSLLVPTAIRTRQTAVCRDTENDPRAMRQECTDQGFASIIALPLQVKAGIFGALAIYAGERDAFDYSEVELLGELASNVAFGLESIKERQQREEAEEKLSQSERRYRTLFERNLAGVFRAAADGSLLEGNEAFVRMLGYDSAEELRALNLPLLCAAAGCAEHWREALMQSGQLVNQELWMLRKDGTPGYLLANMVMLRDEAGQPEFIEGTVLDVTERRQLQAQLLHSQKMDAIGQLAGGIAHDFNNLLMVMRSYAEMSAESASDAGLRRQMDAIVKAADRGAALTRQLLTFSRKQPVSPRVMELNAVLENMTKVLPRALGEDVRVEMHGAAELWPVKADPVQIEQLVLNLAVNARDAMPEGGRLTLETANVVLGPDYVKLHADVAPGEYVMLAVSDTGHGIPPEVLPRIFEPFFTTKERGKGTGLGLPTVYGIARQCGGFVWVYSEAGHGTVFKTYLPRAAAASETASVATQGNQAPRSGSETILLVEDEEAVRSATRDYLSRCGYRIFEANSGEEALRLSDLHSGEIEMLITDAVMPGMNGLVLAQKIAERRPGTRILCVSGYTEASMSAHGMNVGAAFLQKPFSLSALASKVRELLDGPATANAPTREQIVA